MRMRYWPVGWMKPRALMKQINKLGMWTGESGREGLTKLSLPFLVLNLKKKHDIIDIELPNIYLKKKMLLSVCRYRGADSRKAPLIRLICWGSKGGRREEGGIYWSREAPQLLLWMGRGLSLAAAPVDNIYHLQLYGYFAYGDEGSKRWKHDQVQTRTEFLWLNTVRERAGSEDGRWVRRPGSLGLLIWQWFGNALGSLQETLLLQYWLQSVLCLTDSSARRITN